MKKFAAVLTLSLCVTPVFAQGKPCEELKSEILAKLQAKGVKDPDSRLAIVPTEEIKDQKVIGSCEGGKKKITYTVPGADTGSATQPAHSVTPAAEKGSKAPAN